MAGIEAPQLGHDGLHAGHAIRVGHGPGHVPNDGDQDGEAELVGQIEDSSDPVVGRARLRRGNADLRGIPGFLVDDVVDDEHIAADAEEALHVSGRIVGRAAAGRALAIRKSPITRPKMKPAFPAAFEAGRFRGVTVTP